MTTHEEMAKNLVARFDGMELNYVYVGGDPRALLSIARDLLASAIASALADAAREERERCAKVAESQAGGHYMARVVAAAIRSLPDAPPTPG